MVFNEIKYIGVNDHITDLFEGQYKVPNGMAYNSYAIIDEKTAVIDSVDARFTQKWFSNIRRTLASRAPDYLIVQHMEPDHSGSVLSFANEFPNAKIVSSARAFTMMKNFFGTDFADRCVVVGEGDVLTLGKHTLNFITAPMVHWPEVIMTYDSTSRVLFSADAFGKFGSLDADEDWLTEARRYYIGIVGKYGAPVQAVLKKASALDIDVICPLHGPVLTENLGYYIDLYDKWSSYRPEEDGVTIAYTSVYGNTKKAALGLAEALRRNGCTVAVYDLARSDMSSAVADAFRYSKLVLATTTYNGDIFPFMREFIEHLTERGFAGRTVALIENGSWAPTAARTMKKLLEECKNLTFVEPTVTIRSPLSDESTSALNAVAEILSVNVEAPVEAAQDAPVAPKKKYVCKICGYEHECDELPKDFVCPLCKHGAEYFEEIKG